MLCLLAAEKAAAQIIRDNLAGSGLYPGWQWGVCEDARDLETWRDRNPDVVVVSRFLPGEEPLHLLPRLRHLFPTAHIVLLAGTPDEQQRVFLRTAQRHGLYNTVTGKLPGDRPYNIFAALKASREPEKEGYQVVDGDPNMTAEISLPATPEESHGDHNDTSPGEQSMESMKKALEDIADHPQETVDAEAVRRKLWEIVDMLEKGGGASARSALARMANGSRRGILVLTAANKGGVGKTTVAATVAVALSRAGVPTVLVDYDLGAPDVATLLGIRDVPGIEDLAGRPVRKNSISDLIVRKENLDVLPGPMDRTIPSFSPGQLGEITRTLMDMYAVVVGDTAPEYWTKPWLAEIFTLADYVLAVVDQSALSEYDTRSYAPYLLSMGVGPERIGIVVNKYSPRLHSPRSVERVFCSGFKPGLKTLPRVVAVIPENWDTHVQKGYQGEVVGLENVHSHWHRMAENIARIAGYEYSFQGEHQRAGLKGLLARLGKK